MDGRSDGTIHSSCTHSFIHLQIPLLILEFQALERAYCPAELMDSEDPLFILYTSGQCISQVSLN
jgi:acyl-coenzyme A synthetase/AMP-(fatty) acid ligase